MFTNNKHEKGFTLVELLVVLALLAILVTIVIIAVNPVQRIRKARDTVRKSDIKSIAEALEIYSIMNIGRLPHEVLCDSSIGSAISPNCPINPAEAGWSNSGDIYTELVVGNYILKLPTDPINNQTYYYKYEPEEVPPPGPCGPEEDDVCQYWIGALLEQPADPSKPIFRCTSRNPVAGPLCQEVGGNFDTTSP